MTTPTPQDILNNSGFTKDFEAYNNDLSEYNYLYGLSHDVPGNPKSNSLNTIYAQGLGNIDWKSKNVFLILIEVMHQFLDPGTDLMNNKVDLSGQENKCQTALAKCQNDLQKITQETGNGVNGLTAEAHGLDQMIGNLNGTDAQGVFGSGAGDLVTNLTTLRDQIYISGSTSQYNPANASTAYFDTSSTTPSGKMSSYGEMMRNLSIQGDPDNAIEANTNLTNAFNTNNSELEGLSAQSKEELTQWINTVKTLASAGSMFGHAISQVSSTAQQNMRPQ